MSAATAGKEPTGTPDVKAVSAADRQILFPADAGVVDVTAAPYNAAGDGIADDTFAIRKALLAHDWVDGSSGNTAVHKMAPRTVYLPAGTYLISDSLVIEGSSVRLIGAGSGRTTIRLKDSAAGFAAPKYVLHTGNAQALTYDNANSGFSNYVQHLTIDVGAGNPGAIGLRFDAANVASADHLVIRSSDPNKYGHRGMSFETSPGPAMVQQVEIDGFDTGIYFDNKSITNDITLSNVTLTNQRQAGVVNDQKNITFENLVVRNSPVAIRNTSAAATAIVVGGDFSGTGNGAAVRTPAGSYIYLRDVTSSGFSNIVDVGTTRRFVGRSSLREWASLGYYVGSQLKQWTEDNPYVSLRLPIKQAPEFTSVDMSEWASVADFGATPNNDADDDGPAVQAAIDSGATIVYFPYGSYAVKSPVEVRGAVRKVDFMFSGVDRVHKGRIAVGDVAGDTVVMENVGARGDLLQHNSPDTVVFRNVSNYRGHARIVTQAQATGDLFVENTGPHTSVHVTRPVSAWIRQLNRERAGGLTAANGAIVWNLGNNVEDAGNDPRAEQVIALGGSQLEMIGGVFDALGGQEWLPSGPATHQAVDSRVSILMPATIGMGPTGYADVGHWLSDTRRGMVVGDLLKQQQHTVGPLISGRQRVVGIPLYASPPG